MTFPLNKPLTLVGLVLLAVPSVLLAWVLIFDYQAYFWDAEALRCGLDAMLASGDPNLYQGACKGYDWQWMHPPAITRVLAALALIAGIDLLGVAYGLIFMAALAVLIRAARRLSGELIQPLLFLLLLSCGIFVFEILSGNMSIIVVGLLCALIVRQGGEGLAICLLCLFAALLKPHYVLYFLIPCFACRNVVVPLLFTAGLMLWYVADSLLHPQVFADWVEQTLSIVGGETHFGFMKLMELLGVGAREWLIQGGAYLLWCGLLLALAGWRAWRCDGALDRAFLALACVTLMFPRLKEYDCLVVVPLFFWLRSRLSSAWRDRLNGTVLLVGFVLPLLWWLARKLPLLTGEGPVDLRAIVDIRWLLMMQGVFLTATLVLVFLFAVLAPWRDSAAAAEKSGC